MIRIYVIICNIILIYKMDIKCPRGYVVIGGICVPKKQHLTRDYTYASIFNNDDSNHHYHPIDPEPALEPEPEPEPAPEHLNLNLNQHLNHHLMVEIVRELVMMIEHI